MIHDEMILSPILVITLLALIAWYVRGRRSSYSGRRTRQLFEAAVHLEQHARTLELFLEHPDAPDDVKRLLLEFSDTMNDRNAVAMLTQWASNRPLGQPIELEEAMAIECELASLRTRNPELADHFATAVITAVAGASLRWAESAELFEYAFPRMLYVPKRDVVVAITATHFSPRVPFSLRPHVTAMA